MDKMIRKNGLKITLLITAFLLIAGMVIYALQKRVLHSDKDIVCNVYPIKFSLGDTLHFKDATPFAVTRRWELGDGNILVADSGIYKYNKPGYYKVRLIVNNEFSKQIDVQVLDTTTGSGLIDSLVAIDCPATAMQFENVFFKATGKAASQYRWQFGETGNIDSKEQAAVYAYQNPGEYVISLFTDITQYPVRKKITILPSFKVVNDSTSIDDTFRKIDADFKLHLQEIANGNNFNQHYNYLIKKYLCGNERAPIRINGAKVNDFNSYCLGLQFDKKTIIQLVKVGLDDAQKCVTKVDVQQSK